MGRPRSATRRNAPKTPGCREPLAGVANVPAESAPTCQLFLPCTDICRRCKLLVADWRKARLAIMRASNVPRTCHPARSWLCVSLGGRLVALVGASFAGLVVCSLGSSDSSSGLCHRYAKGGLLPRSLIYPLLPCSYLNLQCDLLILDVFDDSEFVPTTHRHGFPGRAPFALLKLVVP